MLGKLFKYDFKWINKIMPAYYILLLMVSIAVRIVESMKQNILIVIIDKILSATFIGCAVSIIISCAMRIWTRFINNNYKDESYLTHTLPVTKNQIFNAKILASISSIILSSLVVIIAIVIVYFNKDTISQIKIMYQSLVDVYNGLFAVCFIIGLILLIILEMIYYMLAGIFGIVMGYRANNYKVIKSIIFGIGSYGVLSTISFIVLGIMSKFVDVKIVANGFPSMNTIKVIGITFIFVYLLYVLAYYFISKTIFKKGVNVE